MHNFTWVSSTMAKFRKENTQRDKRTEGRMEGQNDGRTEQRTDPIL